MTEVLIESLKDSLRLVPFLFLTYLVMELLEHASGKGAGLQQIISRAGKFGPLWGALIGAVPQCGFSAAASYFYMGRVIRLGTLISIYMSTSDEMLPMLISSQVAPETIVHILGAKVCIGMISGFLVELLFGWMARRNRTPRDFVHSSECHTCSSTGPVASAAAHTAKVAVFVFLISVVIGLLIDLVGEPRLSLLFSDLPVLGEAVAGLIGLIPNCGASVVITQLYLDGIIGAGPMMSGLLVSAGVGLLVLFKENNHTVENLTIVGLLYGFSVAWGVIIASLHIGF